MDLSAKKKLLKDKIQYLYPDTFEEILDSLSSKYPQYFRLTGKSNSNTLTSLKKAGIEISLTEFENVYSYSPDVRISDTHAFMNGEIYVQELSSMLPAFEIYEISEGGMIIDLCAAPGSKTTQIYDLLEHPRITAVEVDDRRFKNLTFVIDNYTNGDITLIKGDGRKISRNHPYLKDKFDIVLLDAPCSSEGKIKLHDASIKHWNKKKVKASSKLQKGLIKSAYDLVKPGGYIFYSTCTFSIEENERVVNWLLSKYDDLEVLPFTSHKILKHTPNRKGFVKYKDETYKKSIENTLRILPLEGFTAFYLAKIRKKAD